MSFWLAKGIQEAPPAGSSADLLSGQPTLSTWLTSTLHSGPLANQSFFLSVSQGQSPQRLAWLLRPLKACHTRGGWGAQCAWKLGLWHSSRGVVCEGQLHTAYKS